MSARYGGSGLPLFLFAVVGIVANLLATRSESMTSQCLAIADAVVSAGRNQGSLRSDGVVLLR
jgi:hypothetical protein